MKIKVNLEKETVSIKGLTPAQFALIETLLSHVRLGDGTEASEAAFDILNALDACEDLEFIEPIEMSLGATTDGHIEGVDLWLDSPTLVACEAMSEADIDGLVWDGGEWPFVGGCGSQCGGCDCDDCDC